MTNAFSLLRRRCGMSEPETADFLGVPEQDVMAWENGYRHVPFDVIPQLRGLYRKLEQLAQAEAQRIRRKDPSGAVLELGLACDDWEARQLGLPCVGAHEALLGLVAVRLNRCVRIVAAGSTPATAAAMEACEAARAARSSLRRLGSRPR